MFDLLGRLVNRAGLWIVLAWLAIAGVLWLAAPQWDSVTKDDDVSFFPAHYPSVVGQGLLARGFPDDISSSSVVIVAERPEGRLTPADLKFVDGLSKDIKAKLADDDGPKGKIEKGHGVRGVLDRNERGIGSRMQSKAVEGKGQVALIVAQLRGTYVSKDAKRAVEKLQKEVIERPDPPAGLSISMTGNAMVGYDTSRASTRSLEDTTIATIVLVVVILLVVYRSPLLALIPMATIALCVAVSLWSIALLTKIPGLNFQVINITNVFVIVVLFGAGTDYCLFLIARYREELARGRRGNEALSEAIRQVGGAVVASAGTVILGLGMLWFSTFAKIQYTGPAIALSLVIGLVGALTLAPVLLHWLRGLVFWPFRPPHHELGRDPEIESQEETPLFGFWSEVAGWVVRRPGWILATSFAVLIPFAVVGSRTQPSYDLLGDLGPEQPAIVGARDVPEILLDGRPRPVVDPDPPPDARFPLGPGARGDRGLLANPPGTGQRRRGEVGLAAGGHAPDAPGPTAARPRPARDRVPDLCQLRLGQGPDRRRPGPHHAGRRDLQDQPVLGGEPEDTGPPA